MEAIGNRIEEVGLRLHPGNTRIVYCKDANRRVSYEHTAFTGALVYLRKYDTLHQIAA
ncbi:hypothetical protein [Streptomyces sp. NBC_00289]|uniref:hypothetical protein n=1 Tax=Streptomyces sp. NBC_00289 TaxID=2975703 RepID=UPI00352E1068